MTRKLNFVAVMPKLFDEIRESGETWVDATTKLRREDFVTIFMVQTACTNVQLKTFAVKTC